MPVRIQIRRGTAAEWISANPVLSSGEQGLETDTGKIKIGDGTTTWNNLGYITQYGERQAEELLRESVWWIDASHAGPGQNVPNLGWGGSQLDARVGSTTLSDSNDPLFLDWSGENYVYLPGVNGNYLSVPNEAALQITGDLDLRGQIRPATWTPGGGVMVVAKLGSNARYSYWFSLLSNGKLGISTSPNGYTIVTNESTVATGFSNNEVKWVRVTLDLDDGAGNRVAKFYTSDDGVSWTQLGDTVTTAGTASIYVGTALVEIGSYWQGTAGTSPCAHYRAQVLNGIDGTKVLDIDTSVVSGDSTSFTALTGQTVTVNRSTSGRKSVCVTHPVWLFGTDDYMQVADNALLDFGASDSFTVLAVVRQWATSSNVSLLAKANGVTSTMTGYVLNLNASGNMSHRLGDGTNRQIPGDNTTYSTGDIHITGLVRDTVADTRAAILDGSVIGSATDTTTGGLENSDPLRVGRLGNTYTDMEYIAAAIWRRALSPQEIATITNYYQTRSGYALPRSDKSLPIKSSGGIKYQLTIDDDGSLNTKEL